MVTEIRNPADVSEVVGTAPCLTAADVHRAIEAAHRSQPLWAGVPAKERADLLLEAGRRVRCLEGLSELIVREQGKAKWEADFEAGFPEVIATYYADHAPDLDGGELVAQDALGETYLYRDPVGVVAAITPSNWPLALTYLKVFPALLAGNAVVVKPAPTTPLAVSRAAETIQDLFPPGLLSVVTGTTEEVGGTLLDDPLVRMVSFTGGTGNGKAVAARCATGVKTVALELGGNDAALVLDDVDVTPTLLVSLIAGAFTTTGQICFAVKRVFVPRRLHDEIVEGMLGVLDGYVVGSGLDPASTIGPLHTEAGRARVEALVADARQRGGAVHAGGELTGDPERGWFMQPCLVTGLSDDAPLVAEEQFGPALPILPYDTLDEAIGRINSTEYGLCSSVWTTNEPAGAQVARRLQAGCTFVNSHGLFSADMRAPMGGVKQSGVGREMGREGLVAYTEPHIISNRHL